MEVVMAWIVSPPSPKFIYLILHNPEPVTWLNEGARAFKKVIKVKWGPKSIMIGVLIRRGTKEEAM